MKILLCYTFQNLTVRSSMETFLKTVGALNDETRLQILRFIHKNGEVWFVK